MNLANTAKRDAQVAFGGPARKEQATWVLPDGRRPESVRVVKSTTTGEALPPAL